MKHHLTRRTAALVLLAAAPLGAWADQHAPRARDDVELNELYDDAAMVSIAAGKKQTLQLAPGSATVITAAAIKAMGATDLAQALQAVPGLYVSVETQGYTPVYAFRGIFSGLNPEVLMLLDGTPLNSATVGNRGQGLRWFPVENIARIEVIRGPGSALYGANAFAGVINVITRSFDQAEPDFAGVRVGSWNSREAWLRYQFERAGFMVSAYLQLLGTDGPHESIQKDLQSLLDATFATHASLAPGPLSLAAHGSIAQVNLAYGDWLAKLNYRRDASGLGPGIAEALDPAGTVQTSRLFATLAYRHQHWRDWEFGAELELARLTQYASPNDPRVLPPGTLGGAFPDGVIGNPTWSERHAGGQFNGVYGGLGNHQFLFGAGYRSENLYKATERKNFGVALLAGAGPALVPLPSGVVETAGNPALVYLLPMRRGIAYAYVQDEWRVAPDWMLTAGLRQDRYTDFGNSTNPRAALVWSPTLDLAVKLLYGRSFRAPSFVEEYPGINPTNRGNPGIQPETMATRELIFDWQPLPLLHGGLTLFRYREADIIRFVANRDPSSGATAQNTGAQRGAGAELSFDWRRASSLHVDGSLSLQRAVDPATGKDAGLAPQRRLFLRASRAMGGDWELGGSANHVAGRLRQPNDTRPPIADYTLVSLVLRRSHLPAHCELRVGVGNALNRDVREPSLAPGNIPFDLPMPRRNFYAQLERLF